MGLSGLSYPSGGAAAYCTTADLVTNTGRMLCEEQGERRGELTALPRLAGEAI